MEYAGTNSQSNNDAFAAVVVAAFSFANCLGSQMNTDITLVKTEVTDLTSNTSPQSVNTTQHAGTISGQALPAGTAGVLQFKIGRRYRGGHPRMYLPGRSAADLQTPQLWTASAVADFTAAWNNTVAQMVSNKPAGFTFLQQVNVSYFQGFVNHTFPSGRVRPVPVLRSTPFVDTIESVSTNPHVASQRRRNLQSA